MRLKKALCVLLTFVLVLSSTLSAQAVTTLNIAYIKQQRSNWCWVATALMTGKYRYPSSTVHQAQIVTHVKGSVVNQPATITEVKDATEYVTNDTITFYKSYSYMTFADIQTRINGGKPIQPLVNDTYSGHYYVIYGYNSSSSGNYLYLVDPWDATGKYVSFSSFKNGTWTDDRPWIETVK